MRECCGLGVRVCESSSQSPLQTSLLGASTTTTSSEQVLFQSRLRAQHPATKAVDRHHQQSQIASLLCPRTPSRVCANLRSIDRFASQRGVLGGFAVSSPLALSSAREASALLRGDDIPPATFMCTLSPPGQFAIRLNRGHVSRCRHQSQPLHSAFEPGLCRSIVPESPLQSLANPLQSHTHTFTTQAAGRPISTLLCCLGQ